MSADSLQSEEKSLPAKNILLNKKSQVISARLHRDGLYDVYFLEKILPPS